MTGLFFPDCLPFCLPPDLPLPLAPLVCHDVDDEEEDDTCFGILGLS